MRVLGDDRLVMFGPERLETFYFGLEKEHSYIVVSSGIRELGVCFCVQKGDQSCEKRFECSHSAGS
jgi:hypothetical protein